MAPTSQTQVLGMGQLVMNTINEVTADNDISCTNSLVVCPVELGKNPPIISALCQTVLMRWTTTVPIQVRYYS